MKVFIGGSLNQGGSLKDTSLVISGCCNVEEVPLFLPLVKWLLYRGKGL